MSVMSIQLRADLTRSSPFSLYPYSPPNPRPSPSRLSENSVVFRDSVFVIGPRGPVVYLVRRLLAYAASPNRPSDQIRMAEGSGMRVWRTETLSN